MEKINIADLLRDCPEGMELDCTIFGTKVIYQKIYKTAPYPIVVQTEHGFEFRLTQYGQIHNIVGAECVIFPKGKTTWEGFVPPVEFKDGDILTTDLGSILILKESNESVFYYSCYIALNDVSRIVKNYTQFCIKKGCRLATEEEKAKIFDAIKATGYRWNAETKTLEKLVEPKFKVGDKVKYMNTNICKCIRRYDDILNYYVTSDDNIIKLEKQNDWELVPNKFDINTLVPFEDKVLIRNDESQRWLPAFWGYRVVDGFITTFGWCKYCIPYKGNNKRLLGTTNDCNDFYKTWEE